MVTLIAGSGQATKVRNASTMGSHTIRKSAQAASASCGSQSEHPFMDSNPMAALLPGTIRWGTFLCRFESDPLQ